MHFAVTLPNIGPYFHPRTVAALAIEAEDAGWEGFFLWDHVLMGPAVPVGDPWISLAAAAMSTEKIRLGTMVTPLPRRRPVKLAREAVTLDHLSRGRLILGVGTGSGPWEWDWMGEERDQRKRGDMLDEGLRVLEGIWSGRPFSFRGEHYSISSDEADDRLIFAPKPFQERIPIWVGGSWPNKRPFCRAAEHEGVMPMKAGAGLGEAISPGELREAVDYTLAHRTAEGPFDVAASGRTFDGRDGKTGDGKTAVAAYEEAGATWWLETVDPWSFGWSWQGPWPLEAMAERVREGPCST